MKNTRKAILLAAALAALLPLSLVSCGGSEESSDPGGEPPAEQAAAGYTCPMHEEVHADEPGACPECGMDLVPIED